MSWWSEKAASVRSAIQHDSNLVGYPDGAFWIINPLNDEDRGKLMKLLEPSDLDQLIQHGSEAEAAGVPNAKDIIAKATRARAGAATPRIGWWEQKSAAVHVAIRRTHDFVSYPDGAYWIINALNDQDRATIMTHLDRGDLEQLVAHSGEAASAGVPNATDIAARASAALKASAPAQSTWWGEKVAAVRRAIYDAKNFTGYPDGAFWIINPLNDQDRAKLRTMLDHADLDALVAHQADADAAHVPNGLDIVAKAHAELVARGFTPTPQQSLYELDVSGVDGITVNPVTRTSARYIDNRVNAVTFGLYVGALTPGVGPGAFLLDCEGLNTPVLLPWRYTTFGPDPHTAIEQTVFPTREGAVQAIVEHGLTLQNSFAYYDVVGQLIAPTTFTSTTAPRTIRAVADAVARYVHDVQNELTTLVLTLVGAKLVTVALRFGPKYLADKFKPRVSPEQAEELPPETTPRVLPTIRPRATISQLREILAQGAQSDYFCWRTTDADVAANDTIRFTGSHTQTVTGEAPEGIYVTRLRLRNTGGPYYGEHRVLIRNGDVIVRPTADATEFVVMEDIPPDKGLYFTESDLQQAAGKSPASP